MTSYLTEAIGTFFLVLTIGLCVNLAPFPRRSRSAAR
jgi:hypothetical protein